MNKSKKFINNYFTSPLLAWFHLHGRKDLPWQVPNSPYRVWLSEIMLQQTQVKTVIPYFNRFIECVPTIEDLASASIDTVLSLWAGLGYYSRAHALHKTAHIIMQQFNGEFPSDEKILVTLPGIGPSTAAAIASLAFNKPAAILDGNVIRVLSRFFLIENCIDDKKIKLELANLSKLCLSYDEPRNYSQAIMDLGALCCIPKNPNCMHCPLNVSCLAKKEGMVNQIPIKKLKKAIPVIKQKFVLIYSTDGEIFLEKRPNHGLWSGLWGFPQMDEFDCPLAYLKEQYHLDVQYYEPVKEHQHRFTHFHLHMIVISVRVVKTEISTGKWFTFEKAKNLGIAKPTLDLLQYFFNKMPSEL